jgi:hypothetical protein
VWELLHAAGYDAPVSVDDGLKDGAVAHTFMANVCTLAVPSPILTHC